MQQSVPPIVSPPKPIHLLYVPTIFCNMGCQYCYLGNLTEQKIDTEKAIHTLEFALEKLLSHNYLPFNLSFHGGEVTTLPSKALAALFETAQHYYAQHHATIAQLGFKRNPLHIKTNLLNFSKHYDLLAQYQVSISASIDLPLSLHAKYRVDKKGNSTLDQITDNLRLLANYPHNKKISCVITRDHLRHIDNFIADVHYLQNDIGLNMQRFNLMFGFDSRQNDAKFRSRSDALSMLNQDEQVEFYQRLKKAFAHTELEPGFKQHWFHEFTPDYCCSAINCGDKFFLLQFDGKVYSCPRGQSSPNYYYGNIFEDQIDTIINNGWKVIERNENQLELDEECLHCHYVHYCHAGCTFVRQEAGLTKSYTCQLQKTLYQDDPERYPPLNAEQQARAVKQLLFRNNVKQVTTHYPEKARNITPELIQPPNSLQQIIERDTILKHLYGNKLFHLNINGVEYHLQSPILKNAHAIEYIGKNSHTLLAVHKNALNIACNDSVNNTVLVMVLRNTPVIYGDEGRSKQAHLFDYAIYQPALLEMSTLANDYYWLDLTPVLIQHASLYRKGIKNNLFVTSKALREYHYNKQQKNAFYHIQAINLPFPNIEFLWNFEE